MVRQQAGTWSQPGSPGPFSPVCAQPLRAAVLRWQPSAGKARQPGHGGQHRQRRAPRHARGGVHAGCCQQSLAGGDHTYQPRRPDAEHSGVHSWCHPLPLRCLGVLAQNCFRPAVRHWRRPGCLSQSRRGRPAPDHKRGPGPPAAAGRQEGEDHDRHGRGHQPRAAHARQGRPRARVRAHVPGGRQRGRGRGRRLPRLQRPGGGLVRRGRRRACS
mmetsp:Transcript_66102/g.199671  ORF Transcript_66102/g.199671 Transcript_66102/m.199671 type:complete len:215 (+) Transcript_66102:3-647(+)